MIIDTGIGSAWSAIVQAACDVRVPLIIVSWTIIESIDRELHNALCKLPPCPPLYSLLFHPERYEISPGEEEEGGRELWCLRERCPPPPYTRQHSRIFARQTRATPPLLITLEARQTPEDPLSRMFKVFEDDMYMYMLG